MVRGAPRDGPPAVGRELYFDLDYPLHAPASILAYLLSRRLVEADLELAFHLGRDLFGSYRGLEGRRPSPRDMLLVDTLLALLLYAAERLQRGAISSLAPVRLDLHLKGSSQRVVKHVRPKPVALAPRAEHERLFPKQRLPHTLMAG